MSSIPPTTKREQKFDDICEELNKAYGGAIEVGHNIMDTHLKIGKIMNAWSTLLDLLSYTRTKVQKVRP